MASNCYKIARDVAGLTQERWSECIGVTADMVRRYENGSYCPTDTVVERMIEVSGLSALGYWHLKYRSGLANDLLPEVERLPLPQAVLALLVEMKKIAPLVNELAIIAADGIVDDNELLDFKGIVKELDAVIAAAYAVKVADGYTGIN